MKESAGLKNLRLSLDVVEHQTREFRNFNKTKRFAALSPSDQKAQLEATDRSGREMANLRKAIKIALRSQGLHQ